ncbi:hypothetical protein ABZT03_19655, partial [Streptomyces sp. NPDC005574]
MSPTRWPPASTLAWAGIRVPEVRLVGPSGEQVGIVPLAKALELAQEY